MKFTEEQLARIMKAHAEERLKRYGCRGYPKCGCINQFAYELKRGLQANLHNTNASSWFDAYYDSSWTADHFLAQLKAAGLA